jgi:hypothetical protein
MELTDKEDRIIGRHGRWLRWGGYRRRGSRRSPYHVECRLRNDMTH